MRKITYCLFAMTFVFSAALYAQHTVNDIQQYKGWFKVRIEIENTGNIVYFISQCYPSGEEFNVVGADKEKLPLSLKVFCMAMMEEGLANSFDFDDMIVDEDGLFMQLTSFSFTLIFNFTHPESEILDALGPGMVNRYRDRKW
jgi:hypothetical protein